MVIHKPVYIEGGGSPREVEVIKEVQHDNITFYEIRDEGKIKKVAKTKYETRYRPATPSEKFIMYIIWAKMHGEYIPIITEIMAMLYAMDII